MNTTRTSSTSARSLSFTLALALIGLSFVALLVSNTLQMASNWQVHQRALANQQQSLAHSAAIEVRTFLDERWNMLTTAIKMSQLATAPTEQRAEALKRLLVLDPLLEQLMILDDDRFVVATASQHRQKTVNFLDAALIDDIARQTTLRSRYISSLRVDAATGEPGIVLALPLVDSFENYHGSLIATVNARLLWETIRRQTPDPASLAYIVDRRGICWHAPIQRAYCAARMPLASPLFSNSLAIAPHRSRPCTTLVCPALRLSAATRRLAIPHGQW